MNFNMDFSMHSSMDSSKHSSMDFSMHFSLCRTPSAGRGGGGYINSCRSHSLGRKKKGDEA